MVNQKEEIIFSFSLDQGNLVKDLEKTKKVIVGLKDEQRKLQKAYKDGNITIDEYAEELVHLETQLKRQNNIYNENVRTLTGTKNVLTELTKSNKALADQLGKTQGNVTNITNKFTSLSKETTNAFQQINVAGVSVGDITTKLASFANPATAAVAVVGALGAAYARSTIGAKDLAFAESQLSFATTILTNKFAGLISSSKDGEGLFSQFVNGLLSTVDPTGVTAALSRLAALNQSKLGDLAKEEIGIRDEVNSRLEENQEKLTDIQSEQTSYNEKIGLTNDIITNLRKNESDLLDVKTKQLNILKDQLKIDENNDAVQTAILEKEREISSIRRDTTQKVESINRLEQNLTDAENKRLSILAKENEQLAEIERRLAVRDKGTLTVKKESGEELIPDSINNQIKSEKYLQDSINKLRDESLYMYNKRKQSEVEYTKITSQKKYDITRDSLALISSAVEQDSEGYRILASAVALMDTYKAANAALASGSEISLAYGIAAELAAIYTGLANVAQINGIKFANGGFTGPGVGRPDSSGFKQAGIVHEGEYVTPKRIVDSSSGRYHVNQLESMRLRGYADGGLVTSAATQQTNNNILIQSNILKNLPPIEVSVKEITNKQNRITARENTSRIKR